ncbi:MAG TPA: hypothetical protein DCM05_03430 [Elusimicrobia bacterium]|nr:hypothetical protein [Elusimicrobiota bacterium]
MATDTAWGEQRVPSRPPVLLIDADPSRRAALRSALEKEAYPVDAAAGLREAHKLLAAMSYPIALIDFKLPEGEARQVFLEIRARDPHAALVALVNAGAPEETAEAANQGYYDCLSTPCHPDAAEAAVERAAERYTLIRQLIARSHELASIQHEMDQHIQEGVSEMYRVNERLNRHVRQLTEGREAQQRFIEDLAHELKNPLSVIWGYSSFVLRRPMSEWAADDLTRALDSIHRNAQHLHDLIEELLDSTRLEGHKISLRCETFPALEAVRETAEGLKVQAGEKGLTLTAELPDPSVQVYADRNRLRQVLVNLVGNALKFTPKGGKVVVSAVPEEGAVRFSVSDTGKGIAKKDLDKIFERFYQVQETRHSHKGLGLGLSIVKGLIELHGGRIWAESAPGAGAQFHFTLPATLTIPSSSEEEEEGAASPS